MVNSPCIGLCQYDEKALCKGCYRTAEEITQWINLNDDQKREVLNNSIGRQQELFK